MATTVTLSMKLVIDKKAQRVLFAEASKEVVDFLFFLLTLPVATVVKLLGKESMVGCVGNLYASVEKLDVRSSPARCTGTTYSNCRSYVTTVHSKQCPCCHFTMTTAAQLLPPVPSAARVLVEGIVSYMVTDSLTVTPMSAVSSITLLNTFAVKDVGDLQEKTVQLGYTEGLAILKASLQSKTVLTDVFLGVKKA
ncbi:unnamed protein product [Urochloa decumbens]|uniref:DUF674 family protein n=1 Tax=Urochloa decumbens TaxID=240449 RepID=A0ABC8ZSS2_9POAL